MEREEKQNAGKRMKRSRGGMPQKHIKQKGNKQTNRKHDKQKHHRTRYRTLQEQRIFPAVIADTQTELDTSLEHLKGTAKTLHLDIVDGFFAPNYSLDFAFHLTKSFAYHAHLMVKDPIPWIRKNLNRCELFIPHYEEIKNHAEYIHWMNRKKKPVAFALLPQTPVDHLKVHLYAIDYILILTVHPGFYGSAFIQSALARIQQIKKTNPLVKIIVDGGMNPATINRALKAGADYFVSGSYITKSEKPKKAMEELAKAIY